MINRTTKLRWRRKFRRRRRQVEDMGFQAEDNLEKHFFRRMARLFNVRRFVIGWVTLLGLLIFAVTIQITSLKGYYQELQPTTGGTYTEGMVGSFTNANPIYAVGPVDTSVSRLIFAGLLKYDNKNKLTGDLAQKWDISADGKTYTVVLKPNLTWQDGQPLTADDVVFTYKTIQNPDAASPFLRSWQGIEVKALDKQTITFTLPNILAPFLDSLTAGIVPKHSLDRINVSQLRSASFNTSKPIGSGPFMWDVIEVVDTKSSSSEQHIGLKAFSGYNGGKPKLQSFVIKAYPDEQRLITSFKRKEVDALVGLDRRPDELEKASNVNYMNIPLTAEVMAFLRTDSAMLNEAKTRQALLQSINIPEMLKGLSYPVVAADEPFLRSQFAYDAKLKQYGLSVERAKLLLASAGWDRKTPKATVAKGDAKLVIKLVAQNTPDYAYITQKLQKAWSAIGVETQVTLLGNTDLQTAISNRDYDVLLNGVSIGSDPDVFAYWHSSQADPRSGSRLNFSNYKSEVADKSLEAGRSRLGDQLRTIKYQPFLQAWHDDTPAIALYQPRFLYITRGQLSGLDSRSINTATDRYANVQNWMIHETYSSKK
ncbi:MAG: ABC transporter substrate-binding protein [Candidatus Saccharimonadales bacterium]